MQGSRIVLSLFPSERSHEENPALCCHTSIKARPRFCTCKYNFAENALRFNGSHWDQEKLQSRGVQLLVRTEGQKEDGERHLHMQKNSRMLTGFYQKAPHEVQEEEKEEEEEFVGRKSREGIVKIDTHIASLTACAKNKDLNRGSILHARMIRFGLLEAYPLVGRSLMNVYVNCGALEEAKAVCDKFPILDVAVWNAFIAAYVQHRNFEKALYFFEEMQKAGLDPDTITLTCILKACGSIGDFDKGQQIHAQIAKDGLIEHDIIIGTAVIDMYTKCGLLGRAQEVFDELLLRDVITWNALITGYAHQGCFEEAFKFYEHMQSEGFVPNKVTFISVLKACSRMGALDKGVATHAHIMKLGVLEKDVVIVNTLLDMYVKCGAFSNALQIFGEGTHRDVVSWNTVIGGYAQHMHGAEAVKYFQLMLEEGVIPDGVTFACVLKACGIIRAIDRGRELHAEIVRKGYLGKDIVIANALVDMYAKCGLLADAQEVFDELLDRDVVSWTALITGYVDHECCEEALFCFECMQHEGILMDKVTVVSVLKACGVMGEAQRGQHIHSNICKVSMLERDVVVGTAMVDMYAKCGMLAEAEHIFNVLPVQSPALWNALMNGYAQQLQGEEALRCFDQMQLKGFLPDSFTFVCVFQACGGIGAISQGLALHDVILKDGLLEECYFTGNALVDMYATCGMVAEAHEVFGQLPVRDVVSWNALIQGYAQLGSSHLVFNLLEKMMGEVEGPDIVTITSLLNACTHGGFLDKGQSYFESMGTNYGIVPIAEHLICMVDLFGRAGHLGEVVALVRKMPFAADSALWHSVMSSCQRHGARELGSWAFVQATCLRRNDCAAYVCISDIHAAARY